MPSKALYISKGSPPPFVLEKPLHWFSSSSSDQGEKKKKKTFANSTLNLFPESKALLLKKRGWKQEKQALAASIKKEEGGFPEMQLKGGKEKTLVSKETSFSDIYRS